MEASESQANEILLALLAVRMLGGQGVDVKAPLLKPLLKGPVALALKENLIQKTAIKPDKKKGIAKADHFGLTDAGTAWLNRVASEEQLGATSKGYFQTLQKSLDEEKKALTAKVLATISTPTDTEAIAALAKKLEAIRQEVSKLEAKLPKAETQNPTQQIDAAFAALEAKLQAVIDEAGKSRPLAAAPTPTFETLLKQAYDRSKHFTEVANDMVPMHLLFRETAKLVPDLTIADFHKHILDLWGRREIQMHILNEVHLAPERDKGIFRNEQFYYYLLWNRA